MSVSINQKDFIKALQPPKMKRGNIPKTTEIRGTKAGTLFVTAPAHETKLKGEGSFPYHVVVDARLLHAMMLKLPKSEMMEIDRLDNKLLFRIGGFSLQYTALEIRSA